MWRVFTGGVLSIILYHYPEMQIGTPENTLHTLHTLHRWPLALLHLSVRANVSAPADLDVWTAKRHKRALKLKT